MRKHLYKLLIGIFLLYSITIIAANNKTATISVINQPTTVLNGDMLYLTGSGFAPQDEIKFVTINLIDKDSRLISEVPITDYSLKVNNNGQLSGYLKIEGTPMSVSEISILVYARNSNVIGSNRITVIGDNSTNPGNIYSIRSAGTVTIFDSAVGGRTANADGFADNSEDIDLEGSGWTGSLLLLAQREYSDISASIFVLSTSISTGNAGISVDSLTGYCTTTGSYDVSTKSIRIRVVNDAVETADSGPMLTPDSDPPNLIQAYAFDSTMVRLVFDEPVSEDGNAHERFTFNNSSANPSDLVPVGMQPTANWNLVLSPGFSDLGVPTVQINYTRSTLGDTLYDAAGNQVADVSGVTVADSIPPDTTTLRNSLDNADLSTGEFLGSSTYTLRAHVADGHNDGSLAGVTFEGSNDGSSWTPIGTDGDASDADFQYDWTIGSTRYKMLRARAFDTNGNETISSEVGSATNGFNNNFDDTYRAIITQVVPSTISASAGTFRARVTAKFQNNYGDSTNTTGQNLTLHFTTSTSTESWWNVASGGTPSANQIDLTIMAPADSGNVWYSNTSGGGSPNTLVLTEPAGNFTAHNGDVTADGHTITVIPSTIIQVSNPSPLTNSNIDTIPGYQAITLSVNMSGSEDPGVSDDFRFIWGFSNSASPGSYGVTDTSVDLTVAGGILDFDLKKPVFDNIGAQYNYLYWWVENLSLDPNATILEGEAISSSPSRLIVNPHLVTEAGVSGGDVSGGSLAVGQNNQELVSIKFSSNPSLATILVSGLVFDITASSTVNGFDISTFHLYRDSGTLGTYDGDVELDNASFGGGFVNFNSMNLSVTGSDNYILVTVDVLPGADPLHAIGLVLPDEGAITIQDNVINGSADAITLDPFTNLGTSSDVPLPVELSAFTAKSGYGKITLEWETASELNNEGFYLFRSTKPDGNFEQLNYEIIPGNGNSNTAHSYEYVDKNVEENTTYYYKLSSKDFNGQILANASIISATALALPRTFNIDQNYPNPFNPTTHFSFSIAENSRASLAIYNVLGQKIRTIFDNRLFDPGVYENFFWNATDNSGNSVANGIYYYEFKVPAQNIRQVKKMLYLK